MFYAVVQAWASAERQNEHLPAPWKLGLRRNNFQKPDASNLIRLLDLNLAMTVYLLVSHSHCTRARFIDLVLCSSLMSAPFPAEVSCKIASRLFYCWF